MIRIERVWLATKPLHMRTGTETALARVVQVFGAAQPRPSKTAPQSDGPVVRLRPCAQSKDISVKMYRRGLPLFMTASLESSA